MRWHERYALEEPGALLVAASALVVLAALAAWRRPRRAPVASLALWEAAASGSLANRLLPLVRSLRILLTAAAILLAGALCAGPFERVPGAVRWTLVVDLSPSMDAREGGERTRLAWAVEVAERWLEKLPPGDEVGVLLGADPPRWQLLPSRSRTALRAALAGLRVEAPPADLDAAIAIARSAGTVPMVISDGAGERAEVALPTPGLRFGVGAARSNRALLDFELRADWPAPPVIAWREVLLEGAEPAGFELVDPLGRTSVGEVREAGEWRELELPNWTRGIWELRRVAADPLAWDDAVRFRLEGVLRFGLALRGGEAGRDPHPALGVAVALAARSFEAPLRLLRPDEAPGPEEILVQEGGRLELEGIGPAGALLFGVALTEIAEEPPAEAEREGGMSVLGFSTAHPALRGLPLDRLRVRSVEFLPRPGSAGMTALVDGAGGPLLYEFRAGTRRALGTTFLLAQSNLAAEGTFPVLVHRLLLELVAPARASAPLLRAGERETPWPRVPTDAFAGSELLEPWPTPVSGAPRVFTGEGEFEADGRTWPVELLDEEASRIAPGWQPGLGGVEPERPLRREALGTAIALALVAVLAARALLDVLTGA